MDLRPSCRATNTSYRILSVKLEPSLDQGVASTFEPTEFRSSSCSLRRQRKRRYPYILASVPPISGAYISPNQCRHVCVAELSPPPPVPTHIKSVKNARSFLKYFIDIVGI